MAEIEALEKALRAEALRMALNNQPKKEQPSWLQKIGEFTGGAERGFINLAEGLKQRDIEARKWLGMSPQEIQKATTQEQELLAQRTKREPLPNTFTAKAGEFVGGTVPWLAIPAGGELTLPWRALAAGLTGAGMGYAQPTKPEESVAKNVAVGGVTGAVSPVLMAPVGKALNALKGALPKIYDEAISLSQKHGIPLTLGEIKQNPLIQKAETWLEAVPILGIKGFREKQQKTVMQAGTDFLADYVTNPRLSTTAAMKTANDVYLTGLYEGVKQSGARLPPVIAEQTENAARELVERFPSIFESIQDNHVKRILKNIIGDVKDKTVGTGLINLQGQPITKKITPTFSFDDLWMLRKGIGKEIGDASTETARGQLSRIYSAVSDDMDSMFSKGGDIGNVFKQANEEFKRLSVKFDVVRTAYDKATGTIKGGEIGIFSPKKFATELKNLANDPNYKKNVHWSAEEIDRMTGLANILETAKRAGQFMENPPTGNRWGIPQMMAMGMGMAGGMATVGHPTAGGATLGGELGIAALGKFLTTTEIGKSFSLAASKLEPNSPEMLRIFYNVIPKIATQSMLQETGGQQLQASEILRGIRQAGKSIQ